MDFMGLAGVDFPAVRPMSQVDAVGEFAHVLERVLGQNGSPRPEFSPECRTQLNIFGE